MISELGHFALTLAFFVACIQCVVPLIGAMTGRAALMALAAPAASAHFFLILGSFLALMHAFVTSDFTVRLVALNSHSLKPMIYKISGTWGNHEGSLLLWIVILVGFAAILTRSGRMMPIMLKTRTLAVQGMVSAATCGLTRCTAAGAAQRGAVPGDATLAYRRGLVPRGVRWLAHLWLI